MKLVRGFLSRERPVLMLMLLVSLAAHGGGFFLMRVVDASDVTGWSDRPRVHLLRPELEGGNLREYLHLLADRMDPSLLSLPSMHGFSHKLWAQARPTPVPVVDWKVTPSFLGAPPPPPPPTLLTAAPLEQALQVEAEKPVLPPAAEIPLPGGGPPTTAAVQSVFKLVGGLAERAVVSSPELPSLVHLGGLRPTVLRVGVRADGRVAQALLDRSSGSDAADREALTLIGEVRFAPLPVTLLEEGLAWGQARFYWASQAAVGAETP